MGQQTVALYDKALKEVYVKQITDQLNRCSVVHDMLPKNSDDIGGKYAVIPILVAGNSGVGSRAETAAAPVAGFQDVQSAHVPLKEHVGVLRITHLVMEASGKSRQAFKSAFTTETDGLIRDMKDMVGRQIFNDGTPTLAVIDAADNDSTTVTFSGARSPRIFKNGMVLDFVLANQTAFVAAGVNTVSVTIGSVVYTNTAKTAGTFVVPVAFVRATADRIVTNASMTPGATPVYYEFGGLSGAIGGNGAVGLTTYLGVDGSAYPVWQSPVIDATDPMFTSAELGDDVLQAGMDEAEILSGEALECVVTTYNSRKRYIRGLQADRRFLDNTFESGWGAIGFASGNGLIPVYVDKWCTPNTAYMLTKKFWAVYRLTDFAWMDKAGAVLTKTPGFQMYDATMIYDAEVGGSKRDANARIINLVE